MTGPRAGQVVTGGRRPPRAVNVRPDASAGSRGRALPCRSARISVAAMRRTTLAALTGNRAPPAAVRTPAAVMQRFVVQPGFLLAKIDQIATVIHRELACKETLAQAELLILLATMEHPDQISLARAAGADTSTTALILDNLAARKLIRREANRADRRRSRLQLTAAGRRRAVAAREACAATEARLLEPLRATEAAELVRILRKLGGHPMSAAPPWAPRELDAAENVLASSARFLCRRALQVCEAQFLVCTGALNLTPRQYSLLYILNRHPPLSQVGFARLFGLDPATCALIMKNLYGRGLLERTVSPQDRRERLYSLTAAGEAMLGAAQPLVDKSDRLLSRLLTKTEHRRLVRHLQEITRAHIHRLRFPGALFA